MMKDTAVHERFSSEFRAELFNILNRANFNTPNLVAFTPSGVSPTAGVITSTSTTSRQIQFALEAAVVKAKDVGSPARDLQSRFRFRCWSLCNSSPARVDPTSLIRFTH